jgi:hypothetical protein
MSIIGSNILAGAAGQGGGYVIDNSLRFRLSASAYLSRTPATTSNRKTWTWSGWVKRGNLGGSVLRLFNANNSGSPFYQTALRLDADQLRFFSDATGVSTDVKSSALFRDPSAWFHIVLSINTTQATASNRVKMYVNGSQITQFQTSTYPSQNLDMFINEARSHQIGASVTSTQHFDGYLTEVNFIDGQALTPSSFGDYNEDTGVWQPAKYIGSYGTNGFYLPFSDNTTTTTLAADSSGNGNDWTPNNISLTSGVTYDSMTDTPTPYADGGNFCVINPLYFRTLRPTISNGNLRISTSSANDSYFAGTFGTSTSGKYYYEMTYTSAGNAILVGASNNVDTANANSGTYRSNTGVIHNLDGSTATTGATYTTGDVVGVAINIDSGSVTFYKNNASQGSFSFTAGTEMFVFGRTNGTGSETADFNFGQRPFAYTPPAGFKSLHTGNLPDSAIENGSEYFAATTYTGTGATQSISNDVNGVSFQPDLVWIKARSIAYSHVATNSVAGATKFLVPNGTDSEYTQADTLTSFNPDGFSLGADATYLNFNANTKTYVAWNWKAGGAAVTNTAGSITSQVSASPTAGFSVVTYTGTGANGATVGHSLGVAPSMIILKGRSAGTAGGPWYTYHVSTGATNLLRLNTTAAAASDSIFNYTTPASTTFTLGAPAGFSNGSGENYVAYCFSEVSGFSKFGSYTGNASADGPFVYLGFRPKFVMVKRTDASDSWQIMDTERDTYNPTDSVLFPNLSNAEDSRTVNNYDYLSNGFKLRTSNSGHNANGGTYIYMAFAENPFKNSLAR